MASTDAMTRGGCWSHDAGAMASSRPHDSADTSAKAKAVIAYLRVRESICVCVRVCAPKSWCTFELQYGCARKCKSSRWHTPAPTCTSFHVPHGTCTLVLTHSSISDVTAA